MYCISVWAISTNINSFFLSKLRLLMPCSISSQYNYMDNCKKLFLWYQIFLSYRKESFGSHHLLKEVLNCQSICISTDMQRKWKTADIQIPPTKITYQVKTVRHKIVSQAFCICMLKTLSYLTQPNTLILEGICISDAISIKFQQMTKLTI